MPKEEELEEDFLAEEEKEIQESLLEDEDDLFDEDGDEEHSKVNRKQILTLVAIAVVSFLVFTLFIFPLNEIVRSILIKTGKETGIFMDAKEIHFPVIGRKSFDSFIISFPTGTSVKAEEISLGVSLFGLLQSRLEGDASIGYFSFEGSEWAMSIQTLDIPLRLSPIDDKITKWNGEGEIDISGGKIKESAEIPFLGSLKGTDIRKANLLFKIRSGKLLLERGSLESSLAKFQFQGVIRLSDTLSFSQLDLKVCFTLTEKFAQERQDLVGMVALLPQEGGKTCIPIRGTFSSPKVDLPNLNQLGGGAPKSEGTSIEPAPVP
ncbi:type II secretion system protein GspN [Leptospira sp. 2 VSF19]|uniref:Type II secretion system protein GspN n=1 Tax=Leptospira soteropolitanensis TaxID=2950025 RepID=A0AAW5VJ16_9LEPT|nr:type II secretion system protein GspN [Leptospira soteropolitanensis]MCW7492197.1 type II secretion system protein GspN [Leptospira soteropolitanensis]MCW7499779.1 type II secretion system protein GspN [Leptospira soteropolitanensis]MCW7522030.1 type II secretion system protein GspN [Leptospira soteropolitanensis]MCW7525884.1 type II secretion system protein GspN [Leptospira soteropolitanensis]MCW7530002.1 type II secretion system protein GspN [Leptospira soteropolitanensis]